MTSHTVTEPCPTCGHDRSWQFDLGQVWLSVDSGALYVLDQLPTENVWAHVRRIDVAADDRGRGPDARCALWPEDINRGRWVLVTNWKVTT